MKAPFIIFDGGDGTGKATQAKMTFDQLELVGYKGQVKHIDFPQYKENFMGRILFDCKEGKYGDFSQVLPQAASLIYAGDRFESKEKIEKWLMEKNIVISDRYVSANQIHQGGKIGDPEKRRRFIKWLEDLEYGFLRLPRPDIVILTLKLAPLSKTLLNAATLTISKKTGFILKIPGRALLLSRKKTRVGSKLSVTRMATCFCRRSSIR